MDQWSVVLVTSTHDSIQFWDVFSKKLLHTLNCGHGANSMDMFETDDNKACLVTGGSGLKFWME